MVPALVVFAAKAADSEGGSHAAFYIAGLALALFAVAVSLLGISRPDRFAWTARSRTGVIALAALLVVATAATSVLTA